ncbi:hypothetical protein [Clostridium sp. Marseille-P299]|uniref:hypothetical protein n=1 Tax=Clostridium sp. Marseille-P299 TaxID=1805477 RepID=UPI00083055D8|nr:hypothetical protein [Clostridium sp. Marseille-P299]
MKKNLMRFIFSIMILIGVMLLAQTSAQAASEIASSGFTMDSSTKSTIFEFEMPKDGKVKINIDVKERDSVPGSLTITIQKGYSESSEKIKEFTDIKSDSPVTDAEIALSRGKYYISYKLTNEMGDLTDTALWVNLKVELLPTIPVNIAKLKVNSITSLKGFTKKGYEVLKFGDADMDLVIPFTVKNGGGIYISMGVKDYGFNSIEGTIYKDKECKIPVGKSFVLKERDEFVDYVRTLSGKGTYYIKFTMDSNESMGETAFFIKLYDLNGNNRVISEGKTTIAYQDKANQKILYMITTKSTCILVVNVNPLDNSEGGMATFSLLDKNKKVISKSSKLYNKLTEDGTEFGEIQKVYTVPAGTYYIQVTASSNVYQLESFFLNVESNAGKSKEKARVMKVQETVGKGYLTSADKTSKVDWYKFTLNSDHYVQLYMEYSLDGAFDFEVLDSSGNVKFKYSEELDSNEGNYSTWFGKTFKKGTYYIKVYKRGGSSSVKYNFKLFNYDYGSYN